MHETRNCWRHRFQQRLEKERRMEISSSCRNSFFKLEFCRVFSCKYFIMLYPGFISSLFFFSTFPYPCTHTHTHTHQYVQWHKHVAVMGQELFKSVVKKGPGCKSEKEVWGRNTCLFWDTRNPSKQKSLGVESTYTNLKGLLGRSPYKCEVPLEFGVSAVVTQEERGLCLNKIFVKYKPP